MDDTPRWTLSGAEPVLFGLAMTAERSRLRVSFEGISSPTRTEEWFRAIESGELCVTRPMASDYAIALNQSLTTGSASDADRQHQAASVTGQRTAPVIVDHIVDQIRTQPHGDSCNGWVDRSGFVLNKYSSLDAGEDGSSEFRLVSEDDWFKVFGPWLLSAAIVYTAAQAAVLGTAHEVPSLIEPTSPLLPAGLLIAALAALGLRRANAITRWLGRHSRAAATKQHFVVMAEACTTEHIDPRALDSWRVDPILPFVLPAYRDRVRQAAFRGDLTERCSFGLSLATAIAAVGAIYSLVGHPGWHSLLPIGLAVVTFVVRCTSRKEAAESARELRWLLRIGFGRPSGHVPRANQAQAGS